MTNESDRLAASQAGELMRAIAKRLWKLETRSSPQFDERSYRIAMVLYERRRRRMEVEGKPFKDKPPALVASPKLSIAETLRRRRRAT